MYYEIEVGDRVGFVKRLKLPTKTRFNIPVCLYGLNVEGKPVDKGTTFKVKSMSGNGIIIAVDEFPNGFYFDRIWLEFACTSIEALIANSVVDVENQPF